MKCLILAAGYATRLYPLTENFPKPLLNVQNKTILDWLIDDIDSLDVVDEYIVISNHKFVDYFNAWAQKKKQRIIIVDDGTCNNETRLGAVKDINFAIEMVGIDEDMLVIAGDNLLDFSLTKFIKYALNKKASCVMRYYEASKQILSKCGVVTIDQGDKIINMEEKPKEPKSNWSCPPFYFYSREATRFVKKAIDEGCEIDSPGSFISWLCQKIPVYAMEMPGKRYDIGTLKSYEAVQKEYKGIC